MIVRSEQLSLPVKNPIKIGIMGDFHIDTKRSVRRMNDAIKKMNASEPDMILMVGDYISEYGLGNANRLSQLVQLRCPNKFGVLGNHDYSGLINIRKVKQDVGEKLKNILEQSGVAILKNEVKNIVLKGNKINVIGIDCMWAKNDNLEKVKKEISDGITLLLVHNPDFVLKMGDFSVDLVIAGHTHGFIKIPGTKVVIPNVRIGKEYGMGLKDYYGQKIYVTSGVNESINLPRFWPPEIVILEIKPI